jgi:hypothetical protein
MITSNSTLKCASSETLRDHVELNTEVRTVGDTPA